MATIAGPNIVRTGLVLYLDANNRKSNIRATNNMVDNSGWVVGYSQTGGWPANGDAAQNEILYDTDPWGNQSLVLKTHPNNANANGGWEGIAPGYSVSIDKTKKYRSTVWVRRTSTNSAGNFFHGLHTDGTGDVIKPDGNTETNPYWTCRGIGEFFTQNVWYLHVGHIFPYGSAAMTDSTSGFWSRSGGWINNYGCNIGGDCRFPSNATLLRQRAYHYYANDANSNIELFNPRIDLCDGTEPTIQELLDVGLSQWKDLSGNNNTHIQVNTPSFANSTFTLNETQGFTYGSPITSSTACTVVVFYKTTDTQELWVKGNNDGARYIAASYGNDYYHQNAGAPTYYVDLTATVNPSAARNGNYHMWEAKNVDFSGWTSFQWWQYGGSWNMNGSVAEILVYDRVLTAEESAQNYNALRKKFGI